MSKRHEHWCPVAQTSGLIDVDCTCGAERPGPSYDALRAALARLVAEIAQAVQLIPSLRSIGELCDHWTDDGEAELADCLTGLRDHLSAAIAAAEDALRE